MYEEKKREHVADGEQDNKLISLFKSYLRRIFCLVIHIYHH